MDQFKPIALECDNCGAPLDRNWLRCLYCGTQYALPEPPPNSNASIMPGDMFTMLTGNLLDGKVRVSFGFEAGEAEGFGIQTTPPRDFVQEIVAIAQRRLNRAGYRDVFTMNKKADDSLEIVLGDRTFNSVEEIPDTKLRREIQLAIQEWQDSK
ncbi:MAG: zinc ribbon domain-containing protein [Chloroflexi bacterium]|nr:zinc ribbon domain-containing protein [Chloroflexota bacterium]